MRNVAFSPRSVSLKVGQKVTWVNRERVPHNVVATSGARFRSANLLQNQAFSFRADARGHDPLRLHDPPGHDGHDRRQELTRVGRDRFGAECASMF